MRVLFSAGEPSGDQQAALIARELRKLNPDIQMRGMGGRALRAAGVATDIDSESSASVMGIGAVARNWRKITAAKSALCSLINFWRPDLLIVIDYPDFNLRIAKYAKSVGVPVLYFVPPKVWAWRTWRTHTVGKLCNRIALIFPHEVGHYKKFGYKNSVFVGNPLIAEIDPKEMPISERQEICKKLNLDPQRPIVSFFPGSRQFEIDRHLKPMIRCAEALQRKLPAIQPLFSIAPGIKYGKAPFAATSLDSITILKLSAAALMKSGTSNLQAAACNTPFAMCYTAPRWVELLIVPLLKIPQYSPVNIVTPGTVREFVSSSLPVAAMAEELERLLSDRNYINQIRARLAVVCVALNPEGSSPAKRVAEMAHELAAGDNSGFKALPRAAG